MGDKLSMAYLSEVRKSLVGLQETNDVAQAVSALIIQAADRPFPVSRGRTQFQIKSPLWYDAECRQLRGLAIRVGERLTHAIDDNDELIDECRQYRACKQRKKRSFRNSKIAQIEHACDKNSHEMWNILDSSCPVFSHINQPSCEKCPMKLMPLIISTVSI